LKGERNAEVEDRCSVIRKEIQEGRLPADQRRDCFARLSHLPGAWLHARGPDRGLAAGGARTERTPEEAAAQVKSRFNRGLSAADIDCRRVEGTVAAAIILISYRSDGFVSKNSDDGPFPMPVSRRCGALPYPSQKCGRYCLSCTSGKLVQKQGKLSTFARLVQPSDLLRNRSAYG